jgi:hypothetical protein
MVFMIGAMSSGIAMDRYPLLFRFVLSPKISPNYCKTWCIILMFVVCVGVMMAVSSANWSMVVCRVGSEVSWVCRLSKMVWIRSVAKMNRSGNSGSPYCSPRRW